MRESLEHALPPLDDLPEEEAAALAALSSLDDAEIWREARASLAADRQAMLNSLLQGQGAGTLSVEEEADFQSLLGAYGRLTVRKAHAWLMLSQTRI